MGVSALKKWGGPVSPPMKGYILCRIICHNNQNVTMYIPNSKCMLYHLAYQGVHIYNIIPPSPSNL